MVTAIFLTVEAVFRERILLAFQETLPIADPSFDSFYH
jgi:hypothetical protein